MKIEQVICINKNIIIISYTSSELYQLSCVDTLGIVYKYSQIFETLEAAEVLVRELIELIKFLEV